MYTVSSDIKTFCENAPNMSLPFIINQLCRVGYSPDQIHFKGMMTDYSSKQLVSAVRANDDGVNIELNMGWYGAQSKFKTLFEVIGDDDTPEIKALVDHWVTIQVGLLHPELNELYQCLYEGVKAEHALDPCSLSQLHRQFSALLEPYHFTLQVCSSKEDGKGDGLILGESYLENTNRFILGEGHKNEDIIKIALHLDDNLDEQNIAFIQNWIIYKWLPKYGHYWIGYDIQVNQYVLDAEENFCLPGSLGGENVLQAAEITILELSVDKYIKNMSH